MHKILIISVIFLSACSGRSFYDISPGYMVEDVPFFITTSKNVDLLYQNSQLRVLNKDTIGKTIKYSVVFDNRGTFSFKVRERGEEKQVTVNVLKKESPAIEFRGNYSDMTKDYPYEMRNFYNLNFIARTHYKTPYTLIYTLINFKYGNDDIGYYTGSNGKALDSAFYAKLYYSNNKRVKVSDFKVAYNTDTIVVPDIFNFVIDTSGFTTIDLDNLITTKFYHKISFSEISKNDGFEQIDLKKDKVNLLVLELPGSENLVELINQFGDQIIYAPYFSDMPIAFNIDSLKGNYTLKISGDAGKYELPINVK